MPVIYPEEHLEPGLSLVAVLGFAGALPLAMALVALTLTLAKRARARRADADSVASTPLEPGDAVLHGTVELAPGHSEAVRVEVEQTGFEGKDTHSWREHERRTSAQPFYLNDVRGERVRVEPGDDVQLVDELSGVRRVDALTRVRSAALEPGEPVYAVGQLVHGNDPDAAYRGGQRALVLRPPRNAPMLLSTEPLGEQLRRDGRLHRGFALAFAVVLVGLQLACAPFYARLLLSESATGQVTALRHHTTSANRNTVDHYEVTVRLPGGGELVQDADIDGWGTLAEGASVPVRDAGFTAQLGDGPTVHGFLLVAAIVLCGLVSLSYLAGVKLSKPWWKQKVDDLNLRGGLPPVEGGG